MSDVPAGWYPDPQPVAPGQSPQQRYWDGSAWTAHLAPMTPQEQPAQQPPYGGSPYVEAPYGGDQIGGSPYGGSPYGASQYGASAYPTTGQPVYGAPVVATTPDGQPLAGWWQRVGATLIDACILIPLGVLLSIPFWPRIGEVFGDYFDEVNRAVDAGTQGPSATALQSELGTTFALIGLIQLVLYVAYQVGFLVWKQATPGKLALGLRVRRRDEPGPMPLTTVLLRCLAQSAGNIVGLIPLIGAIGSLYTLLDVLWPLWDAKKQALHDKVAGTNVVRTR